MKRALRTVLGMALAASVVAGPAQAQFSKGYKFLQSVREKNGQEVTDEVNKPGSTMINTQDVTTGETALHIVIARRDATWLGFLLAKGADPNIRNAKGASPLQMASSMGFIEAVEALVGKGARIDDGDVTGETPLIAATHRKDLAMMRVLLKAGANPDRADSSGRSARDYATLDGKSSPALAVIEENAKVKRGSAAGSYGPKL